MEEWPKAPEEERMARFGVHLVGTKVHQDLKWVFRETSSTDLGIDGEIELIEGDQSSHGKRLSVQIKCGLSYLREETENQFVFRGHYKHLKYWTEFSNPVLIILCDPESEQCWWQHVDINSVRFHERSWSIYVPKCQTLSGSLSDELSSVANLYQKNILIELLIRDWLGWRFQHQIQFASDFAIPRDYHWLSMLAQTNSEFIMIDYLIAEIHGFRLEDVSEMVKYAKSNHDLYGYEHFFLAFVSENLQHLREIPEPSEVNGVTVQFVPFLLKRRSMEIYEVGENNTLIEVDEYEYQNVTHTFVGDVKRLIKWSGEVQPCA